MSGMEAEERWFWVWLSIYLVPLGTAPFIIWEWKYPVWGTICGIVGLGGLLMLVRDRLATTASKLPIRISLKILTVITLSMLVGQLIGYEIAGRRANVQMSSAQWWLYGLTLLFIVVVASAALSKKKPSKLVIHWANYRAVEGGGEEFQVGDCLRQLISGDSLVFDIENHNFVIGDKNFVPRDPLWGKEKRLEVNYSYGGDPPVTTSRREHGRLLLPEDSKIKWLAGEVDRLKAAQPRPGQYPIPQLRWKVVTTVSELQGFLGEHGDEPHIASILSGRTAKEYDQDLAQIVVPWRAKVASAYRLRFNDSLPKLRDEMAARAQVTDAILNDLIHKATTEASPDVTIFKDIIQRLWELGLKLNA
jgi:hypothetical protein